MNENLKKEEFRKLENRIWKTYQSRIKGATYLLNMSKVLELYSVIYTICLTILSVFTLISNSKIICYFTVIISIVLMGLTFYGNTMNYKDRYISMKDNYLKLGDLYYNCLNEKINETYDIETIYGEYSKLLKTVENHSKRDYLSYMLNDIEEKSKINKFEKVKYILKNVEIEIVKAIIILIPIAFVIYTIYLVK